MVDGVMVRGAEPGLDELNPTESERRALQAPVYVPAFSVTLDPGADLEAADRGSAVAFGVRPATARQTNLTTTAQARATRVDAAGERSRRPATHARAYRAEDPD